MDWIEILGYAASGAVFVTLWLRTAVPVRIAAAIASAVFAAYGAHAGAAPLMMLHGWMLPVAAWRLYETAKLNDRLRTLARADFDIQSMTGFMTRMELSRGSQLFARGDDARDIFYLLDGTVRIEDLDTELGPGQLIGEMAMFAPDKRRTQTVRCTEDCTFLKISEARALQAYTDNPEFGLYLTRMMVARLLANADRVPEPVVA